jgi:transposase
MDIIYHRVAGLDLHKVTIVAEVRCLNRQGKLERDLRSFGTMTRDLLQLSDWLSEHGVTHVAMEATDVLGVSGREMLGRLAAGDRDPAELAQLARGRMRRKIPQLELALEGELRDHHRFMLRQLLTHLDHLDEQVARFSARIEELLVPFVDKELQRKLQAIPGIDLRTIENVVAEIGLDMNQFPSDRHLASWTGICPGNEESAGKRKRARTTRGNRWLRRALAEAAWAASHTHDTYLAAQYRRLAARRGKKRALVAVAHSLLVILYHVVKYRVDYQDLGADYFLRLEPERLRRYLVKRLEQLGYEVELVPTQAA